jgi:hypothetical protein
VVAGAPGDDHGDPFIIKFLDAFYLYHTGATAGRRGVSVHRSHDLVHWEFAGYALEAAETGWAWSDLWAPEVVYERGVFYMYITGASRREGPPQGRWETATGGDDTRRPRPRGRSGRVTTANGRCSDAATRSSTVTAKSDVPRYTVRMRMAG